jgi:capsid portal protein
MSEEKITEAQLAEILEKNAVPPSDEGENIIEEVFITGDDRIASSMDLQKELIRGSMSCFDSERIHKEAQNSALLDVMKTVEGSTQTDDELGQGDLGSASLSMTKVVEPPYPPELLAAFLEVDSTHFRCVKTKTVDAVGREWSLDPVVNVVSDEEGDKTVAFARNGKSSAKIPPQVSQSQVEVEVDAIKEFINDSNELIGFEGVLFRACMDYEAIGWAAIEVIRSADMKIRKLAHIPATRIRPLRGWKGFVEVMSDSKFVYYQPFGSKVVSQEKSPVSGEPLPYDPKKHGELKPGSLSWNMCDRETGLPTSNFSRSANEVIWIPKHHASTIYYGYADVVPALGDVLGNVHIRDFMLQFFEHNTVPRYAVVIEGAKLAKDVKDAIMQYFGQHVKGKAHKTLIIPVPAMRGEVKLRFEKLAADAQEGSFQETRKNNSQGIMTAHGVSPAIIGIAEHSELGSGKGLSQAEIYKDRIVTPSQRVWEHHLNRLLKLGLGSTLVHLKFNPLDIRDREAEKNVYISYLEKGVMTINQVAKRLGIAPVVGGDRNFIMTNAGAIFVDELTEAASVEKQQLEDEIEGMKMQMSARSQAQNIANQQGGSEPKEDEDAESAEQDR